MEELAKLTSAVEEELMKWTSAVADVKATRHSLRKTVVRAPPLRLQMELFADGEKFKKISKAEISLPIEINSGLAFRRCGSQRH